jgi:two-component sensor histidine kinase
MYKTLLICLTLLLPSIRIMSQQRSFDSPDILLVRIKETHADTNRIRLLLELGGYYLNKRGRYKNDLDSAFMLYRQAMHLSSLLRSVKWQNESLKLKGNYYIEIPDLKNGKACFMQVTNYYQKVGDKRQEAQTWLDLGNCISNENTSFSEEKLKCYEHARLLFREVHDRLNEIIAFKNEADVHLNEGKLDLAEGELHQVLVQYKAVHYPRLHHTYFLLSAVSRLKGDLHKELYYNLEVVKCMQATADTTDAGLFYYRLAETYEDLGMNDKSLFYFKTSLAKYKLRHLDIYYVLPQIVRILITENRTREALSYLQKNVREAPPANPFQNNMMYLALGNCYRALKQYDKAEHYYLEMIKVSDISYQAGNTSIEIHLRDYKLVCEFFLLTRRYQKANFYLQKVLAQPKEIISPIILSQIQLLLFKTDSASGNYVSAINHFQLYKKLNDSIFNATKSKQIEELQISYETDQKDKNIQLLKKQAQLQRNQVEQTRTTRNMMIGGTVMLLLLLGVGYNRYRLKQRSNLQLRESQREVSAKNIALEQLLHDNEWLLREVHHRVKNNLQIVMSLLNSQSAYLKDEPTLNAIMDSQHRVQAMSLIHQKLYMSNNVSNIYMPDYINDLIDYLKDSFKTGQTIYFELRLAAINLYIARAVPVGLILNEIITNAIKYAFPHSVDDKIKIEFYRSSAEEITLIVADNGRGLPDNFDMDNSASFGMILIKGLTEDLGGTFTLENSNGTTLIMVFNDKPPDKRGLHGVL